MRKALLVLLLAMLPLQWSAAAVAALCLLPGAQIDVQATASAPAHAIAQADEAGHAHNQALASAGDHASHDHGAQHHGHGGKALHADHGGCCHVTGSALLPQFALGRLQAAPADLVARMTVLAVSHPSESPFRPPRLALA